MTDRGGNPFAIKFPAPHPSDDSGRGGVEDVAWLRAQVAMAEGLLSERDVSGPLGDGGFSCHIDELRSRLRAAESRAVTDPAKVNGDHPPVEEENRRRPRRIIVDPREWGKDAAD